MEECKDFKDVYDRCFEQQVKKKLARFVLDPQAAQACEPPFRVSYRVWFCVKHNIFTDKKCFLTGIKGLLRGGYAKKDRSKQNGQLAQQPQQQGKRLAKDDVITIALDRSWHRDIRYSLDRTLRI